MTVLRDALVVLILLMLEVSCSQGQRNESFPITADAQTKGTMSTTETKQRRLTYVAIGASDTVGVGARDPANESWVAILSKRLPQGSKFLRLGISGSTATQAAIHQLPVAKTSNPDLVTIWLALNDFDMVELPEYQAAMDEVLSIANGGKTRVFVANIPDLSGVPAYDDESPEELSRKVDEWNDTIARLAAKHGAVVVDLFEPSQALASTDIPLVSEDGFHPSTEGYKLIAELFWNYISQDPVVGPAVEDPA